MGGTEQRPGPLVQRHQVPLAEQADRFGLGQIALDLVGWGTAFVDFDNDGWLDLFVANGSTLQQRDKPSELVPMHPHLYWNRGPDVGFFEVGGEAGLRTNRLLALKAS